MNKQSSSRGTDSRTFRLAVANPETMEQDRKKGFPARLDRGDGKELRRSGRAFVQKKKGGHLPPICRYNLISGGEGADTPRQTKAARTKSKTPLITRKAALPFVDGS